MPNTDELHAFRVDVDRRLTRLEVEFESISEKIDTVISTIGQQSSIIRGFEDERQREIGSRGMIKFLWGILLTGMTSIAYNLHDIVGFLFPPKH